MTLALRELQAAFVAHLIGADRAALVDTVVGDSIPAAARLRVHRHHLLDSLVNALGTTFPTVQRLVGDDFFGQLGRPFVVANLPVQPVLSEYGADFPAFVERHASVHALPYLADVARLDWALNVAFHSPDAPRLAQADLASLSPEALSARPLVFVAGTTLIHSAYPLDRIWAISQPGATGTVAVDEGGACLLVFRALGDADFAALDPGETAFAASLEAGQSLEKATEEAFGVQPEFNLSKAFARFVALGVFAALQHG